MVSFDKSATAALKRKGYSPETVKQTIIDFHRLTGGRLPRVTFTTKRGQRAAAQTTAGVVYVAGDMTRATMFHELAHILEDDDKTRLVATAFRDNRAKGNAQSLRTLTGNKSYDSNERAVPDNFVDPYVGKVYAHGSTEVFSMGLQYLSSPDVLEVLMQKDPDHLNMIIGYLSEKPRLDGQKVEGQKDAHVKKQVKLQSAEDFAKKLDKKIAAAGEFWLKSGITVQAEEAYLPCRSRVVDFLFPLRRRIILGQEHEGHETGPLVAHRQRRAGTWTVQPQRPDRIQHSSGGNPRLGHRQR
jgi:hypothetical protein